MIRLRFSARVFSTQNGSLKAYSSGKVKHLSGYWPDLQEALGNRNSRLAKIARLCHQYLNRVQAAESEKSLEVFAPEQAL